MLNKAFSQLSDAERVKKLITVIRKQTGIYLDAEQIKALTQNLDINRQYIITVYSANDGSCEALIEGNVLRIYIPKQKSI